MLWPLFNALSGYVLHCFKLKTSLGFRDRPMRFFLLLLICVIASNACSQTLPSREQKKVSTTTYMVSASHFDYRVAADTIVGHSTSKYEQAKQIYLWLCRNVSYDGSQQIRTADEAWTQRKAVCQGYCELFFRLAETKGLQVELVYGKIKGPEMKKSGLEKHVWLSVKTERGAILLDPTWGAGKIVNSRFEHNANPLEWFDVNPTWLLFTHQAVKIQKQYNASQLTEAQFTELPYAAPALERIGWNANDAFADSKSGSRPFPTVIPFDAPKLKFQSVPKYRNLVVGKSYTFTVAGLSSEESICLQDASGKKLDAIASNSGNVHTLIFQASKQSVVRLSLMRSNGFFNRVFPLLEYEIVTSE